MNKSKKAISEFFVTSSAVIQHHRRSYRYSRLFREKFYWGMNANALKIIDLKIQTDSQETIDKICYKHVCSAGLNSLLVDPFGGIHLCGGFLKSLSNFREENLQSIWKKVNVAARKKFPRFCDITPACKTCEYIESCHVCIAELEREDMTFSNCGHVIVEAKAATKIYF